MGYRALADAIIAVHFAFLGYVVVGGFIALRWRWTIWPHLAASAWGIAIVTVPTLVCPLTTAQNWAMRRGGEPGSIGGFIDTYVKNVIYPARYTTEVQILVGLVVLTSWALVYRKSLQRRRRDRLSRPTADLRRA